MAPRKKKPRKILPAKKKTIKKQISSTHKMKKPAIVFLVGAFVLLFSLTAFKNELFSQITDKISEATLQATVQMGFKIREVNVTGRHRTDSELLRTLLNVERGDPIFAFSPNDATRFIKEVSWIENVQIRRRLPDTIDVYIEEREPIALWQNKGELAVIDKNGNILTKDDLDEFSYLPLLVGKTAPKHAPDIIAMLKAEPKITNYLDTIIRVGDRRWDLKLANNTRIKLPEKDPEFALSKLLKMHANDNILEKNWEYIDMRLDDKIIMKPVTSSAKTGTKNKKSYSLH